MSFQSERIGRRESDKGKLYARCHILKMSVNGPSMECQRFLALHHGKSRGLRDAIRP